jgi:hypothetical protein
LQQKKIQGLKPKIYELRRTKMMFKPIFNNNTPYDNVVYYLQL